MSPTQPSTRKRHQKDRAAPFGNTLAEYAVIGCTVVVMSIAAFLVLGGNLNGHMQNLRDDMAAHILTVSQAQAATVKQPPGAEAMPYIPGAKICYSGNICLDMAAINAQNNVQSTGANGARMGIVQQAGLLDDIARQLANDPNADQTLVDLVTRLSNAGHTVGDDLDQSIATIDNYSDFYNAYDSFWRSIMPVGDLKSQLDSYVQAHPQSLTPEMKGIIDKATQSISDNVGSLVSTNGPNYDNWDAMINAPTPVPAGVHENSNKICRQGGKLSACIR